MYSHNKLVFNLLIISVMSFYIICVSIIDTHIAKTYIIHIHNTSTSSKPSMNVDSNIVFIKNEDPKTITPTIETMSPSLTTTTNDRIRTSSTQPNFVLYLHPKGDLVSDTFYNNGYWGDCIDHMRKITTYFIINDENKHKFVVVDIGANIGACSLFFASKGFRVYSFEPVKSNFRLFNMSINENAHKLLGSITAINAGANSSGTIHLSTEEIYSEGGNYGNSIIGGDGSDLSKDQLRRLGTGGKYTKSIIHLTTIDHIVKEHVHYMKLDCQGCELKALQGARKLLSEYKIDVIRLEFSVALIKTQKQDPLDLLLLLHSYNYSIYKQDGTQIVSSVKSFKHFIARYDSNVAFEDILAVRQRS
jgi:FkbM family methyltransferase